MKRKTYLVFLFVLLLLVHANAEVHQGDLSAFCADFSSLAKSTNIISWSEREQNDFLELAKKHGLISAKSELSEYQWSSPGLALYAIFETIYGQDRYWTLEQSHQYSRVAYESGLEDSIKYLIPPEGSLSQEDAINIATTEIRKKFDAGLLPCDIAMLNDCFPRVLYVLHDPAPIWMISFYHEHVPRVALFSAEVFNEKEVQVSCYDSDDMYNLYKSWRIERGLKLFRYWSLEDQKQFYELLLKVSDRQMKVYGELPPFAKLILSNQHDLPSENEIQPHEAIAIAHNMLREKHDFVFDNNESLQQSLMFFRSENHSSVYEIRIYRENEELIRILVQADTGEASIVTDKEN